MAVLDLTNKVDLLEVERQAILLLSQGLNDIISASMATWSADDATYYAALGRADPAFTYETVDPENFYPGHVPSLIEAPIEKYPNVAAICSTATPQVTTDDWGEKYNLALAIEVMAKSVKSEEEANARTKRLAEAVHKVFVTNDGRRLGGLVPMLGETPSITNGDVFVRRAEKGRGDRWFWQGARLAYTVVKPVVY